jgi:hypothetical protein
MMLLIKFYSSCDLRKKRPDFYSDNFLILFGETYKQHTTVRAMRMGPGGKGPTT